MEDPTFHVAAPVTFARAGAGDGVQVDGTLLFELLPGDPGVLTQGFPLLGHVVVHVGVLQVVLDGAKLPKHGVDHATVTVRDFMKPAIIGVHSPQSYEANNLEVAQNTPEDIRAAVREMLDRLDGRFEDGEEDRERARQYMALSSVCGIEQNSRPVAAFLKAYPDLLEGAA